jgi:hypothetical protein
LNHGELSFLVGDEDAEEEDVRAVDEALSTERLPTAEHTDTDGPPPAALADTIEALDRELGDSGGTDEGETGIESSDAAPLTAQEAWGAFEHERFKTELSDLGEKYGAVEAGGSEKRREFYEELMQLLKSVAILIERPNGTTVRALPTERSNGYAQQPIDRLAEAVNALVTQYETEGPIDNAGDRMPPTPAEEHLKDVINKVFGT